MSTNEPKYPGAVVEIGRTDGNALAVDCAAARALKGAGAATEEVDRFRADALSGDYGHVLRTTAEWVSFR